MRGEDLGAVSLSVVVAGKLDLDRRGKEGEMFRPSSSEYQPIWWDHGYNRMRMRKKRGMA